MKKLLILSFWGAILLLSAASLAAQNSVDVLNNGPQPAKHRRLRREPAMYSGGVVYDVQCRLGH
jgi:hypothetical protein